MTDEQIHKRIQKEVEFITNLEELVNHYLVVRDAYRLWRKDKLSVEEFHEAVYGLGEEISSDGQD
jgi:hypothetical protein